MSCRENDVLIQGYLDGELDLAGTLQFEAHLRECTSCAMAYKSHRTLQSAIRDGGLYFQPPTGLATRVRSSLRGAESSGRDPAISIRATSGPRPWWNSWVLAGAFASMILAVVVVLRFLPGAARSSSNDLLAQEVVAAHVRSLMADHLMDVPSSDQHTVKPWFDGKLDFSPPVQNLESQGFALVGGRLDYLQNRPVAALVYQRRKHFINLFVWPSSGEAAKKVLTRQGYNAWHWTGSGMTYWAVSDLNNSELSDFVRLLQSQR